MPHIDYKFSCAGQSPSGEKICADRTLCARFVRTDIFKDGDQPFWLAEGDCIHYTSLSGYVPIQVIKKDDWDEKRMDTIGQNSNEGLHYDEVKANDD